MITQFQGDAILAVFNLPLADPHHALSAVTAGIAIRRLVAENRFNGQQLHCRIGINTGEVIAGNVGARDRLGYTAHGDAVNVAARLDHLNKELGTDLLISETCADQLGDDTPSLRDIGNMALRGKSRYVHVLEVL